MIRKSTKKDLKQMTTLKNSSKEQNQYLRNVLETKKISYSDCYVYEKRGIIVGRGVFLGNTIGLLTVEELTQKEVTNFISEITKEREWETTLYQDKIKFQLLHTGLLESGFKLVSERERYECYELEELPSMLSYKGLNELSEEMMIDLFEQVQHNHLDPTFEDGSPSEYFQFLKELEYTPDLWIIAFEKDNPVGFVVLQDFGGGESVINYIGVIPRFRGKGYSGEMIQYVQSVAKRKGFKKIVAEIDQHNFPLRDMFLKHNFFLENKLYKYKK